MTRTSNSHARLIGMLAGAAMLAAGCGLFSSGPTPAAPSGSGASGPTATPAITPSPSPTPHRVGSITLVAALGEPKAATPAGLAWAGIQATSGRIGATATLVQPATKAAMESEIDKAAGADLAVVVTVGSDPAAAVLVAAASHPKTQFLEVGVVVTDGAPANVHGLVFDEAEAGYLAGYIAASFSSSGAVGIVGDTATDSSSANYVGGFRAGAAQAAQTATATAGYAGTADAPEKGRTAAAALIKAGSDTIVAMPSLSGIGAMRQTCALKARIVAVDTDAWQTVPDVKTCLIASVLNRYDTAVGGALMALAAGTALPALVMNDVSNDGIAVSDLHADAPAGFAANLADVVAALKGNPPRATAAPASAAPEAASPSAT